MILFVINKLLLHKLVLNNLYKDVYRGYIVFAISVTMFFCLSVCKLFFLSKISQQLLDLGF